MNILRYFLFGPCNCHAIHSKADESEEFEEDDDDDEATATAVGKTHLFKKKHQYLNFHQKNNKNIH